MLSIESNASNRSNNRDCSLSEYLFLRRKGTMKTLKMELKFRNKELNLRKRIKTLEKDQTTRKKEQKKL